MIYHPPVCSPEWTTDERVAYVLWMCDISMTRMKADPGPMLVKSAVLSLWNTVWQVLKLPAAVLERNRTALMKPYDTDKDVHGLLLPEPVFKAMVEAFEAIR